MVFPSQSVFFILLTILALLGSSCSISVSKENGLSPTVQVITATLPPTLPPRPSNTPPPPTIEPTIVPVYGVTTTRVNVRREPNTAAPVIGILENASQVQVIGKDPGGIWFQILYPDGPEGKGWLTVLYIRLEDAVDVPVVGASGESSLGGTGVIIQKVNVRSGPGTEYDSLGMLNPQDVVELTGKNDYGTWLQIKFQDGPGGFGWLTSAYVQVKNVETLPIISISGEIVGTGTPAPVPSTPTPTLVSAPLDNDSLQAPAISIVFSSSTSRSFSFTSDVSSPEGDGEDWIAFRPDYALPGQPVIVSFTLFCSGNGALTVDILHKNQLMGDWGGLTCVERDRIVKLSAGQNFIIHLQAVPSINELQYCRYTLIVQSLL